MRFITDQYRRPADIVPGRRESQDKHNDWLNSQDKHYNDWLNSYGILRKGPLDFEVDENNEKITEIVLKYS